MKNRGGAGRVLLAMDVSPRSKAALETATILAAEMDAELVGLFIEDVNLLRLGSLPFAREIGFFSSVSRPISPEDMEYALQHEAGEVQRLLAEAAGRLSLKWSFHVARGQIATELFAYASEPDLVVLGKRARFGPRLLGEAPLRQATGPGPVVVVFDGSAGAHRVLEIARRMASVNGTKPRLLIPAETESDFSRVVEEIKALSMKERIPVPFCQRLVAADTRALAKIVNDWQASVLVLDGDGHFRGSEGFFTLLNEIDCPVIMIG